MSYSLRGKIFCFISEKKIASVVFVRLILIGETYNIINI